MPFHAKGRGLVKKIDTTSMARSYHFTERKSDKIALKTKITVSYKSLIHSEAKDISPSLSLYCYLNAFNKSYEKEGWCFSLDVSVAAMLI